MSKPVGFWGLVVTNGNKYTQKAPYNYTITMATFDPVLIDNKRTSLIITRNDSEFVLCNLIPGVIEQQVLNHTVLLGETITISIQGKNKIHLTGNYVDLSRFPNENDSKPVRYELLASSTFTETKFNESDKQSDSSNNLSGGEHTIKSQGVETPSTSKINSKTNNEGGSKGGNSNVKGNGKLKRSIDALNANDTSTASSNNANSDGKDVANNSKKANTNKNHVTDNNNKTDNVKNDNDKNDNHVEETNYEKKKSKKRKTKNVEGVLITDVKNGEGKQAKNGRRVGVRYIGRLKDGKVFDSNTTGKPFSFTLGKSEVIRGWDVGINGMCVGGERKLVIPPVLAYGAKGCPPDIPRNATLEFEVKLLNVD